MQLSAATAEVDRVTRDGDRYTVEAGDRVFEAEHGVVAMSEYRHPRIPAFASKLDPTIGSFTGRTIAGRRSCATVRCYSWALIAGRLRTRVGTALGQQAFAVQ